MRQQITKLLIAGSALCLVGCGNKEKTIDTEKLMTSLLNEVDYDDELQQLETEEISNYMDVVDGAKGVMYMSSGSTAESVAIFTTDSEKSADMMEANIEMFLRDQEAAFEDYNPKEAKKIDDAVLEQEGKYVILCVSNDSDTAETIIERALED